MHLVEIAEGHAGALTLENRARPRLHRQIASARVTGPLRLYSAFLRRRMNRTAPRPTAISAHTMRSIVESM